MKHNYLQIQCNLTSEDMTKDFDLYSKHVYQVMLIFLIELQTIKFYQLLSLGNKHNLDAWGLLLYFFPILDKRRLYGDLIVVFKYLKRGL